MAADSRFHWGHAPFVRFQLALMAGVGIAVGMPPHPRIHALVGGALLAAAGTAALIGGVTRLRKARYYTLLGLLAMAALFAWGWWSAWRLSPQIDRTHFSHHPGTVFVGYIDRTPVYGDGTIRFPVSLTTVYDGVHLSAVSGRLMMTVDVRSVSRKPDFAYGEELRWTGQHREIPPPYNPGEPDYRNYLAHQRIWHQAYLSADAVQPTGGRKGNPVVSFALAVRQRLVDRLERYLPEGDELAVASALLLGDRAELSNERIVAFSDTGTIHMLSVSGMHVVLVFALLANLLRWMDRSPTLRLFRVAVCILGVWGYALLTGFSPSVLRAAIMLSCALITAALGRTHRIYNTIAASAFLMLFFKPELIADIGFQLSYLAVLGIVYGYPHLKTAFPAHCRSVRVVRDFVAVSVSAQAGAGPMAAYHFHQFPVYFLLANLFALVPITICMYLGFLVLALPPGPLTAALGKAIATLIALTIQGLETIGSWPLASIRGLWPSWWELISIYLLLAALPLVFTGHGRPWAFVALLSLAVPVLNAFWHALKCQRQFVLICFNVRSHVAVGLIRGREAWLYTDLNPPDHHTLRYSVWPALERYASPGRIHVLQAGQPFRDHRVFTSGGIIQFDRLRLMVDDGTTTYAGSLQVDILLLRRNAYRSLATLRQSIGFRLLILDGSNSDATIRRVQAEADQLGIPVYILKDNQAYVQERKG